MAAETPRLHVVCDEDCDNAPKKRLVKSLTIALVGGDGTSLASHLDDATVWHCADGAKHQGTTAILAHVLGLGREGASEMRIESILTHGPGAAVHGVLTFPDGRTSRFCHIYRFKSAKSETIREATSFAGVDPPTPETDRGQAVVERIKRYFEPWLRDRRMRIAGEMVLKEIARIETEEAAKSRKDA